MAGVQQSAAQCIPGWVELLCKSVRFPPLPLCVTSTYANAFWRMTPFAQLVE
jgi:hypothetical protein